MRAHRLPLLAAVALGLFVSLGPGEAQAAKAAKTKVELSGVINLNEATAEQLDLLPGVGKKAAERIIQHRTRRPFKRTAELVWVKGFGRKRFAKLKEHLAVTGPTTLTATRVSAGGKEGGEVGSDPPATAEAQDRVRAQARAMTRIKR